MKALIILLVITITHNQLEAQIQSTTTSTKQLKPLIEVVFLKPTKHDHQDNNFESAYTGRYVVDNSIDGDYIPFKSAFAKKNRFFLNRRDAIEQNEISANEIPKTPNFPIIYQKFQYSKKKADKLDLRNKIDKYNLKNKFIEATRSVKLSKASSKSQKLYDKNRIFCANFKEKSSKLRPTPRMTFREFVKNMKRKINLEYSASNLNNSSTEVEKLHIVDLAPHGNLKNPKLTLDEFIHAMNSKIKNNSSNVPLSKVPTEVQKLNDKIEFLKFHIFGTNSSGHPKEPKLSLKEFIQEIKFNNNVTGNSHNMNLSKVPSIEVQKLNDKIDFLKFHIFGPNSSEPSKEPKLSLKEFIHEMKLKRNVTGISQNNNLSKVPSIEVQKLNDKIDFLKFHIFGTNSSEPLKKPKLSLKEFMHEMNFNNSTISNLNSSQIPIEVQKLNDKIDFLKSHIFGPTLSEPKLSLKEFMHEMKLELNSRRNSNSNNFESSLKNMSQDAQTKNSLFPEPNFLIEDNMQQDIDGSHQEISPTSPNHPKNRISNELQVPRELWAFAFNYEKFTFNPLRQPAIFKRLIKVPEYLKIPKYEEKVNRSLPRLILPFEKYEKFIRFVETDNKLLPQAITLFFGELPPMPSIPRRVELHQLEKRSTKILLPLIYKATEFQIYNEKNEVIYKVDESYWEKVKGKLSIKFSPNNTAEELVPLLPEFYRSLNFTTNPDDLLPLSIKWLKLFVEDGRWFGPNRNKTTPYREYDYEFEEYYAEGNINYLLGYFKRMQQDVLKQYLNMGGHGLPKPEQSFAFYVEVPEGAEPDFINIIEWGVELLTPRNHRWHEFNDTYEEVFIGDFNFQEPPAPTREKRLVNRIPSINVIECEVELITPKGTKVFKFNGEDVLQKVPSRIKRSEHTIPLDDPGLPPQILLALASVSGNGRRNIGESHTMHLHPNNKEVTSTKSVVPGFSETHKLNVPPSPSSVNDVASPGTSLEKIYSFPISEYISQDVLPVFSDIEKDKPLIQRIIEKVKQGKDFFIHRNSNFPRSRFVHKYTNIRKNPLPKGTKKITINYGVPVYLKVVNDEIKPHEVYGPPQPRSKRSTLFETVFGNNKKLLHQRFYETSRTNYDKSDSVIGSKSIRNTYVKSDSVIGSKSISTNTNDKQISLKSRSDIPTIIDSKCIVYGFPELFVKPKKEMSLPVSKSRKISKVKISYGVPVYLRPYVAGSKSSKATLPYPNSISFDLPATTKSRPFAGSNPNDNFVTNFVPVTTKPKPFAVSNAEETTLKVPEANSSKVSQKSGEKSQTITGETVRYSYYLGPNPANITVSREYFSETQPEKPQKVYDVPRTKRSIFNSFFKHNDNFETLQQRFFKVVKHFPVQKEAYEFPMASSPPLRQIQRKFIRELPNDQNNMRFSVLTPKLVLPKSDEAKFITLNPILGTEPIQPKSINVHLNLSLPKTFSIKSFNKSYTNDGQINRMFLPTTFTRPFKNVDDNIEVSPANEGSKVPSEEFPNNKQSLPKNFLIKSFNTDGYTHDVQSNRMLLPSTITRSFETSYDNIKVSSANGDLKIPSDNSSNNNNSNVHLNSSLPKTFLIKSSNGSYTNDVRFNRMILPSTFIENSNTSNANINNVSASHEELKTPSTNSSTNKFLYKLYLPKLQLPETFNPNNTENDANLYRISLPSTITRNLKDPVKIEIPEKQTFEPRPVSIYFFKSNITAYQLLHYYLAPKVERSGPFSNSTSRSKRSIFASVFSNDGSKSLQQRFHEGSRGNAQYPHHNCKHSFSHRNQVQTARLQEYGVPFGSYGVPKYAIDTQKSNKLSLPRIRLTKYFYNKLGQNFNQLPIATRKRPFDKPLASPEGNKSPNSPVEAARLQIATFKSVLFGKYAVNSHLPLRNGMILPKIRANKYLNSKPYVTLTLPLIKNYGNVAFEENFNQLPIAIKTRPFGEPLARPMVNRSEIVLPNSPNNIENYTSSTSELQIPVNANERNIFLVNKNVTKYLSAPGTEFSKKSNGLHLPSLNPNNTKSDFALIKPVESYPKLPQALVDNINYNAQFSVGIASNKDDGLPNGSKNHRFEGKFNTSFNNSKNKSFVAPAVPLNQSVDYPLEISKTLPHLPKVESMNSFSSTLEPVKNISESVNLPKILKNNSFIENVPHLPKVDETKKFNKNTEPLKNNSNANLVLNTLTNNSFIEILYKLPKVVSGHHFTQNLQSLNLPESFEEINVSFNQAHALKVPKAGPKIQNFNRDNNTIVSTHLRGKIKYSSRFRINKTNNNTNNTKYKINGQISAVPAPIDNDLKIPKTDIKDKYFSPGSEENEYNSLLIPTKTKNNQNLLSKKSLKLPKANSITGRFITKDTTNFPINLTVQEPIGNELKIPITGSTAQHFNTENITNLPTNLPAAIEENIKYNSQFIPTITDIMTSSTTQNALKIPKTHSTFLNFNLKNTTNSSTSLPTLFRRIGNVPKIRKTQQFNSKTSTNLPPNLPKATEENIKYNSQFVPAKTDNSKTQSIENYLKITKADSKIQHFKPETIVDGKITPQNVTNSKIPLTMQFQIPKNSKGFMFKENAMLWPKVNIIRQNKTFVPVIDNTLKENIAYNAQFIKQLNVSHKNPEETGIKEISTNPPQIVIENSQTNNNTNKTNEPSFIEDNELPKENSVKRLEDTFLKNTPQKVQNVEVTSQAVKHRKRPVSIVAQWLKNKTLESSKPTNKDNNRADIPIEEEISDNTQIKNPLYVANRAKYPLTNKVNIKSNNTKVNIRKNLSNLYNVNNTKSRFIFKNKTQKNNTVDALDNDNLPEKNIVSNLSDKKKKKVLVKVVKRPSRKNIVASMLNEERAAENPEVMNRERAAENPE